MNGARLRLAALLAVGAMGAAPSARDETVVSIEAASITRREALVRVLDAAGEDYVVGPGFGERVALELDAVPISRVLRGLLRDDERSRVVDGVRRVARSGAVEAGASLRLIPVPNADPAELARLVAVSLGPGARVAADVEAKLLLVQGAPAALEEAERIVVKYEAPLPCPCEPGDRDLLAGAAKSPGGLSLPSPPERITATEKSVPAGQAILALAKRAGVPLAPVSAEGEVSYRLRGVSAGAALEAVADVLGGARVEDGALVLGPSARTAFVDLRSRRASQLLPVLRELGFGRGPLEITGARDRLVLRGAAEAVGQASLVARRLDFPPRPSANPCGCRPR